MKNTILVLLGFAVAGAVGAYFAKKEVEKIIKILDDFDSSF